MQITPTSLFTLHKPQDLKCTATVNFKITNQPIIVKNKIGSHNGKLRLVFFNQFTLTSVLKLADLNVSFLV
jgi:hypothetical protein